MLDRFHYAVDTKEETANKLCLTGYHEQLAGPRHYIILACTEQEAIQRGKGLDQEKSMTPSELERFKYGDAFTPIRTNK